MRFEGLLDGPAAGTGLEAAALHLGLGLLLCSTRSTAAAVTGEHVNTALQSSQRQTRSGDVYVARATW